jgi:hypothetical protein
LFYLSCGALHLVGDSKSDRRKCCSFGRYLSAESCYPKLLPLPNEIRNIAINRIRHFNKNCAYYNNILSIACIGVDNGRGGGFEKINGESCVKLNGRTYISMPYSSRKGSGIHYFTFDALLDLENSVNIFNNNMENKFSDSHINKYYMSKIFGELKNINPFAEELKLIGNEIKSNEHIFAMNNEVINLRSRINTKTHHFEIGAILSDNSTGNINFKYKLKNNTFYISSCSEKVESLCFPILFPYGENGFSTKIQKEVGCMTYMCSRWLMAEIIDESKLSNQHQCIEVTDENEEFLIKSYFPEANNNETINDNKIFVKVLNNSKKVLCILNNSKKKFLPVSRFQIMTRVAQYHMVDLYSRSQDYKLNWHKNNQKLIFGKDQNLIFGQVEYDSKYLNKLKQDTTKPLLKDRNVHSNSDPSFLAASYTGGPRHLKNCAISALTVVSDSGGPTLFITVTVNPYWPEILEMLLPGQTAYDRPDIVVRVFFRKLKKLLNKIRRGDYFDGMLVEYMMRVIEYQHRGFPHAHIVVKLRGAPDKFSSKTDICQFIDKYISAELPDINTEPIICGICEVNMVHVCRRGVNGCLDKYGNCKRGYDSTDIIENTYIDERGFPIYKKRNIKDLKIVPFHKKMLEHWNGHINVEFCATTFAVLYLYKYLFKGNNKLKIHFENTSDLHPKDEINHFLRGRLVTTMDTMWRGFGYQTYPATEPPCTILNCKLPEHVELLLQAGKFCDQLIYFRRPARLQNLKFTEFFNQYDYNSFYPKTYNKLLRNNDNNSKNNTNDIIDAINAEFDHNNSDVLNNYNSDSDSDNDEDNYDVDNNDDLFNHGAEGPTFDDLVFNISNQCLDILGDSNNNQKQIYIYKKPSKRRSITRMGMVNVTMGEIFYLRTILNNIAVSGWDDILTVNNEVCSTFQEAAIKRLLINEQTEGLKCFEENVHFSTPAELRNMFIVLTLQGHQTLCIFNDENLKEAMYEDYYYDSSDTLSYRNKNFCINKLLIEIQSKLRDADKSLSQYGLPEPEKAKTELEIMKLKYNSDIERENYKKMNIDSPNTKEQQLFMDDITSAINENRGMLVYLQGDAGSGKTTTAKKILSYTRSLKKIALGCASTGLAAKNYDEFDTAHGLFKYPVIEDMEDIDNINDIKPDLDNNPERKELIESASVIIWDEAPSNELNLFLAVFKYFNYFANKVIILIGDWKQCPPVVQNGVMEDICKASILNSHIWDIFTIYEFTLNLRVTTLKTCNRCNSNSCGCIEKQKLYSEMLVCIGNGVIDYKTVFPVSKKSEVGEDVDSFMSHHHDNNNNNNNSNNNNNDSSETDDLSLLSPNSMDGSISVKIPILKAIISDEDEAINFVFPNLINNSNNNNQNIFSSGKSAILCATNEYVDEWNERIQDLNENEPHIYKSSDAFDYVDDPNDILKEMLTEEVLHRFNKTGVPKHILKLKVNDICFVMRNLLKKEGLTNNTRVKITELKRFSIRVCTVDTEIPKFFIIPRILFKVTLPYGRSFTMLRKQFPLRLAYSMTYNKSQGQELKRCLVDIRKPPFVHGHLYVALSRIRYFDDIRIFCTDENIDNQDNCIVINNFVYNRLRI